MCVNEVCHSTCVHYRATAIGSARWICIYDRDSAGPLHCTKYSQAVYFADDRETFYNEGRAPLFSSVEERITLPA